MNKVKVVAFTAVLAVLSDQAMAQTAMEAQAKQQVIEFAIKFADLVNKQDASGAALMFTEDAIYVSPGGIKRGRAAIEDQVSGDIKAGAHDLAISPDTVRLEGSAILSTGTYTIKVKDQMIHGYFSTVQVQQDGKIVIKQNMSAPARP